MADAGADVSVTDHAGDGVSDVTLDGTPLGTTPLRPVTVV